jgi:hypothetical protein
LRESPRKAPGNPNSAAFLKNLWLSSYSLLLCAKDHSTAQELREWMKTKPTKCVVAEVYGAIGSLRTFECQATSSFSPSIRT